MTELQPLNNCIDISLGIAYFIAAIALGQLLLCIIFWALLSTHQQRVETKLQRIIEKLQNASPGKSPEHDLEPTPSYDKEHSPIQQSLSQ